MGDVDPSGPKFLMDANVHNGVGQVFESRRHPVDYVHDLFLPGTPDTDIDVIAREEGFVIVSHDQNFLKKIQQPRFNFVEPASSGYGRIMLCDRESDLPARVAHIAPLIEELFRWASISGHRFLVSIGPNWVRFDDQPLRRTSRSIGRPDGLEADSSEIET